MLSQPGSTATQQDSCRIPARVSVERVHGGGRSPRSAVEVLFPCRHDLSQPSDSSDIYDGSGGLNSKGSALHEILEILGPHSP